MRFAHFCVDRPIFASVLSIVLLLIGAISYLNLPVVQYPDIAPPTIVVRAQYPGANAETVAATVATALEQEINGVEDMLYMSSYSTSDGAMSLTTRSNEPGPSSCSSCMESTSPVRISACGGSIPLNSVRSMPSTRPRGPTFCAA